MGWLFCFYNFSVQVQEDYIAAGTGLKFFKVYRNVLVYSEKFICFFSGNNDFILYTLITVNTQPEAHPEGLPEYF